MKDISFKKFLHIFRHIKPNRAIYFLTLTFDCIVEISFYLLTPIVMKLMIDAAVKSEMKMLRSGLILTLVICLGGMVLFVILEFYLFRSFDVTTSSIRKQLFRVILKLPVSYVEKTHSGDTTSRLTNDIDIMKNAYGWQFRMILVTMLTGLSSGLVMFLLDWKVSLVLITIGLISVGINLKQAKFLKKINDRIQKSLGKYTENLSNIINCFMSIKSIGLEKSMQDRAYQINKDLFDNNIQLTKKSAFVESRNFLFSSLNFLGVIILASILAINGINSLGSIVSMVLLLGNVNRMFGEINNMIIKLQGFTSGSDRVMQLMDTTIESDKIGIEMMVENDVEIALKAVVFSYNGEARILDEVSMTVKRGQVAALVGPSGSGKSTIIKLIMGFYATTGGQLAIRGEVEGDITSTELRSRIAYVPQDAYVFDGTIEENIRYGKLDASTQDIIAAAKAAHADEFIQKLEKGYETFVGERGIKLSGGQRQRIAVARAFLKDAEILLLDEATSSLDSQSEQLVQEALNTLMEGRTTIIIAHRLSTIENADIIYLLDKGRIVDYGNHNDLISRENLYQSLHRIQFE